MIFEHQNIWRDFNVLEVFPNSKSTQVSVKMPSKYVNNAGLVRGLFQCSGLPSYAKVAVQV